MILNRISILIFLLFQLTCSSSYEQQRMEIRAKQEPKFIPFATAYWGGIDWQSLPKPNILFYKGKDEPELNKGHNYCPSENNISGYLQQSNIPYFIWMCRPLDEFIENKGFLPVRVLYTVATEWRDKAQNNFHKNFGSDPFEEANIKAKLEKELQIPFIEIEKYQFDVSNYSIPEKTYKIDCGEDKLKIPLDVDIANKIRNLKTRIYIFSQYLPPKEIKTVVRECKQQNQFAKDGCLQWGNREVKYLQWTKKPIMVSILSFENSHEIISKGLDFSTNISLLKFKKECPIAF